MKDINGRFLLIELKTVNRKGEKLKVIEISKRNLIVSVILAVVVTTSILVINNLPRYTEQSENPLIDEERLASTTAVLAVEKVFQVNYQEGKDVWLERICENSTSAGCEIFTVGADRLWEKYMDEKSVVTATAQIVQKMADNDTEQVWEVSIDLSTPLPGSNKTHDTAYVVVMKTENGWKFDRFLMQAEIETILNRQSSSSSPAVEGHK